MIESPKQQIEKTEILLKILSEQANRTKNITWLHKENEFNQRYSIVLSALDNFKLLIERLEYNIKESEKINKIIYKRFEKEDKDKISEKGQKLRKQNRYLTRQNATDFKALYIFSKIFLDEYINLLAYMLSLKDKRIKFLNNYKNPSISVLFNSLKNYNGENKIILDFCDECLKKFKAVDIFISQYRNVPIIHSQPERHKETEHTISGMGSIRFWSDKQQSITPKELVFVVDGLVEYTSKYIINNILN